MKHILGGLLALLSCFAFADGATLVTAGPAVPAAVRQHFTQNPMVVSVQPITINHGVFGANVLTVEIDGKTHTFVGSMVRSSDPKIIDAWRGKEGDLYNGGFLASVSREKATGKVSVDVMSATLHYETAIFKGHTLLVQKDYSKALPMKAVESTMPTPQEPKK